MNEKDRLAYIEKQRNEAKIAIHNEKNAEREKYGLSPLPLQADIEEKMLIEELQKARKTQPNIKIETLKGMVKNETLNLPKVPDKPP